MMKPVVDAVTEPTDTTEPPTIVGEVKQPEEPATEQPTEPTEPTVVEEPTEPTDTTPPTVVEVGWYSDSQLTEVITDDVQPGDTLYTKVVFSEPMQHTVADDNTARPALSVVIDGVATRYRMVAHGASGNAFASGSAKPLHSDTHNFICKYTIPTDVSGTVALRIGGATADMAGNTIAEVSEYVPSFVVAEPIVKPTPPTSVDTDDPHLQRAIEIIKRAWTRYEESGIAEKALKEYEETGIYPWEWVNGEIDKIYIEETGFEYFTIFFRTVILTDIYTEENPKDYERVRTANYSTRGMEVEYLRLRFTYPDKDQHDIFQMFRKSCRDGIISIERGQFF